MHLDFFLLTAASFRPQSLTKNSDLEKAVSELHFLAISARDKSVIDFHMIFTVV